MRDEICIQTATTAAKSDTPAYLEADTVPWTPWVKTGLAFKLISVDMSTGGFSVFLKLEPGTRGLTYGHIGSFEGIVLSGSISFDDEVKTKGDFFFEEGGEVRRPLTEDGCTLFLTSGGPLIGYNFIIDTTSVIDARRVYDMARAAGAVDHIGSVSGLLEALQNATDPVAPPVPSG